MIKEAYAMTVPDESAPVGAQRMRQKGILRESSPRGVVAAELLKVKFLL